MGEVFLAWDPRLERRVAIKRIRPDVDLSPERRARLLREARLAASLSHAAVVQVFDLLAEDGADHIVMEYVPGTTLWDALRTGPLPPARAFPIALAVAEGLAYAHGRGVIHRDIKTENVLLSPEGAAKISDFGIARRALEEDGGERLTREGIVLGTARTMSPEQACGDPADARSDLFSFGVLLYELFAGLSPFAAATARETVRNILQHRPSPVHEVVSGLPLDLSDLVDHLLEKDSALRPRDAQEVASRLRRLAGESTAAGEATLLGDTLDLSPPRATAPAAPAPPLLTASTRLHRRRWPRVTLAAAALGGVAAAGLYFLPMGADPGRPVTVAVLAPKLQGAAAGEETAFLAFVLRGALQSSLTSLQEVFPKSTSEVDAVPGTPVQVARALAADELLETAFACRERSCSVELTRLRGGDGAATWSGRIDVPVGEPLTASRAMDVLVRQAYRDREPRPGFPGVRVSPADYAEYLDVWRTVTENGGADPGPLIRRLERLRRRAPELVEPYYLQAVLESNQFFSGARDPARLERALGLFNRAQALAPGNPEILFARASTEIRAGRSAEAEATLAAFERLAPGDVRVLDLRAMLADQQGHPGEALALYRRGIERQPSWGRLYDLARLALRQGDAATARRSLETLLSRSPGNPFGQQLLANLELMNGDARRAAHLYEEIAARGPRHGVLANLGTARLLVGDYAGAAAALDQARAAAPDNYFYLLNLAQVRWLQGRRREAEDLLRRVLELSGQDPAREDPQRLTVRAQSLALLGRNREAVAEAQEALQLAPRSGSVAFEAALVYSIVGDRTAAEVNAERARGLGFDGPAWFRLPWFEPSRSELTPSRRDAR
jgi:serine/threonine-protein kinase